MLCSLLSYLDDLLGGACLRAKLTTWFEMHNPKYMSRPGNRLYQYIHYMQYQVNESIITTDNFNKHFF